jgi:hypothetical protein
VDVVNRSGIAGWAANSDNPAEEVVLRIVIDGQPTRAIANILRPDCRPFPNATGRYGFASDAASLPLSPYVAHDVAVFFAKTGAPVSGGTVHIPVAGSAGNAEHTPGSRRPIILTSTGRAGSSLLMARLAQHPDIIVAHQHPYEIKLLSYYASAYRTLVCEANRQKSTDPDSLGVPNQRFYIGQNPYNSLFDWRDPVMRRYWAETAPDILRKAVTGSINAYYAAAGEKAGKPNAAYFAEKIGTSELVRQAAHFMFGPVTEIVLVRDPRDIVCSSQKFWRRDVNASILSLRGQFVMLSRPPAHPTTRRHVLRYEDLAMRPHEAMTELFEFLGVSSDISAIDPDVEAKVFKSHGTSATVDATIGRWRRDLSDEEAAVANRELLPFIEHYGYHVV